MNSKVFVLLIPLVVAVTAPTLMCGAEEPHIGYIYPAGGQAGSTNTVLIGGQFLKDATGIHVMGGGIQAKVVKYFREWAQNDIIRNRNRLQKLVQTVDKKQGEERKKMESEISALKKGFIEQGYTDDGRKRKVPFDPRKQPNAQIAEQVTLQVAIAPQAVPGRREIRLMTPQGMSNPMVFHVGKLREVREKEPNTSWQDVRKADRTLGALPVVLNGQIKPGDIDRHLIKAKKGQKLVFNTQARSLVPYLADAVPGWFQATLALYDTNRNEVAYADDYYFDPDPILYYEVPKDDIYVLEVKDAIYRGREDFVYRIAMGEWPYPKGRFPFEKSDGPREVEPNNNLASAQAVKLPSTVTGQIGQAGDWDVYRVQGKAGADLVAEVKARRWGSPLDAVLKLTDAEGKILEIADDHVDKGAGLTTHHADAYMRVKLPADGSYFVHLGDTQKKGGDAFGYRLRISQPWPNYELRVEPATINMKAGGTVPVTVHALRRDGFKGPIRVSLVNPPDGFRIDGNVIPWGQEKVRVTLTVPRSVATKRFVLNLQGHAKIGERTITRPAVPVDDQMQAFLYRHLVPARAWVVNVTQPTKVAMKAAIPDGIVRIPSGGTREIVLSSVLSKQIYGNPKFELSDPPDGLSIRKKLIKAQANQAILTLYADGKKLKPGIRGNLVVDALANSKKRFVLCTAPAVPFEVVKKELAPKPPPSAKPSAKPWTKPAPAKKAPPKKPVTQNATK